MLQIEVGALRNRLYGFGIPVFVIWLAYWVILSWPGALDDAFIHLRYADNLLRTHLITYDGVHSNYGASSLLYVYLLSFLRVFSQSPNLARFVSSVVHLLLFVGITFIFIRFVPSKSSLASLLGLVMLFILVSPSAVRWLDDGMETGLVICFVTLMCLITFSQSARSSIPRLRYLVFAIVGFLAVLLRIELMLLCGLTLVMLIGNELFDRSKPLNLVQFSRVLRASSHLFLGGVLALGLIRIEMHFFLPDTALAKSTGIPNLHNAIMATSAVLVGALTFGAGMFFCWILTFILLFRVGSFSTTDLLANLVFPILFALAALRGQQIQGYRYFAWTLVFSTMWNILAISRVLLNQQLSKQTIRSVCCFIAILVIALPFEAKVMYPVLKGRADLAKKFEGSHLDFFQDKRGIATDIGYIGYFSRADICDLDNLVNGRDKARVDLKSRVKACVAEQPDFMFLEPGGINRVGTYVSLENWKTCDTFDFRNVNSVSHHYLLVPSTALEACRNRADATHPSDAKLANK
jgi:hypothetical protein